MQATQTIENVTLSLPNADLSMLRLISRRMGWKMKTRRKSGLEKALEDVAAGRVYEAKNLEQLENAENRKQALKKDMIPEQLYSLISEEIDDIYANGWL